MIWLKKTDLNAKITEIESKIPNITGLASNSTLTAVENKILDVSSLVKKTDYNTKISEIEMKVNDNNHDKYITTREFNTLAARVFNVKLAQADLVTKTDFDAKLKKISGRVTSNKSKHLLVETEFKKLEKFDTAYCRGKNYFKGDRTQNYLVFQPVHKYFTLVSVNDVSSWESKGLFNEKISSYTTTDNFLHSPILHDDNARLKLKPEGYPLKQDVNIYIVYRLTTIIGSANPLTLENCLFGAIRSTTNADVDKYKYSGYGTAFDSKGSSTHPDRGYDRNVIIFGDDLSNSKHANNANEKRFSPWSRFYTRN